ncbi:MAG TPA: hypothetical protein VM287_12935 [Egibacteraceae bacterium]|nr:hypothetical protein [Egibacteraceae bacterium]
MTRSGVSYFGSRILRHVRADMADIRCRGFDAVLHTFTENDLRHYPGQMGAIVDTSHRLGLHVVMAPWGVGGMFGGEAESRFVGENPAACQRMADGSPLPGACPNDGRTRALITRWIDAAADAGADGVFWDEPHWLDPKVCGFEDGGETCFCHACAEGFAAAYGQPLEPGTPHLPEFRDASLVDVLTMATAHAAERGLENTVCVVPPEQAAGGIRDWEKVAAITDLSVLATDPYWALVSEDVAPYVERYSRKIVELAGRYGLRPQIWILGFGLGPHDAADIETAVQVARDAGADDIWVWGYEACGHMDFMNTAEPEAVWEVLTAAVVGRTKGATPDE